jgi:hypothetical protein
LKLFFSTAALRDDESEEDLSRYAYKALSFTEESGIPLKETVIMASLAPPPGAELLRSSDDESRAGDVAKPSPDGSVVQPLLEAPDKQESALTIAFQVCLPFLVAGMGMVAAGIYLDMVQVLQMQTFNNRIFVSN